MWGAATAAFQIEGAADGRGESTWDRFATRPGAVSDGSDGHRACDHHGRWFDDVALMRRLGLGAYRFSISWPRVVPDGDGEVHQPGLDFYDRLVDGLLDVGIEPCPTLFHWDTPQALEDRGGWEMRATAEAFARYADIVTSRLGDRVHTWFTLNEPFVVAWKGYTTGEHAPGRVDPRAGLAAAHHLLLGHGLAVPVIRANVRRPKVGVVLNFTPVHAGGDDPASRRRTQLVDAIENRWFVEPVAGLGYPADAAAQRGWDQREVLDGDLDTIAAPIDVLGVNYYSRQVSGPDGPLHRPGTPVTEMGWEIYPRGLADTLRWLHRSYRLDEYLVTENGAAMPDEADGDGEVDDVDRVEYLRDHLYALHGVIDEVPVRGYFVWSLLDNFEWEHGYSRRFGIVRVDYDTLERTPKASARWYACVARTGRVG